MTNKPFNWKINLFCIALLLIFFCSTIWWMAYKTQKIINVNNCLEPIAAEICTEKEMILHEVSYLGKNKSWFDCQDLNLSEYLLFEWDYFTEEEVVSCGG